MNERDRKANVIVWNQMLRMNAMTTNKSKTKVVIVTRKDTSTDLLLPTRGYFVLISKIKPALRRSKEVGRLPLSGLTKDHLLGQSCHPSLAQPFRYSLSFHSLREYLVFAYILITYSACSCASITERRTPSSWEHESTQVSLNRYPSLRLT